jgi:GT2 family glycosyltransferase
VKGLPPDTHLLDAPRGAYGRPGHAAIIIVIPVLGRAERLAPLLASINENTTVAHYTNFVCSPGDDAAIEAASELPAVTTVVDWQPDRGDYARKINHAVALADGSYDWIFTGATDIEFTKDWDLLAFAAAEASPERAGVIGTVDNCNPRTRGAMHSTHSLVARWFIEQRGHVLHEGYWHNFVDDELITVARSLRAYVPSAAVVQHFHPLHGTAPDDDTYQRGQQNFADDRRLFARRKATRFR